MDETDDKKEWKQAVGFPINYDSDQSSNDNFSEEEVVLRRPWSGGGGGGGGVGGGGSSTRLLADAGDGAPADLLGSTPPRARIRTKEKRRSNMDAEGAGAGAGPGLRMLKDHRRNTVDNFYQATSPAEPTERAKKRASLKLVRTRERDLKLSTEREFRAESLPSPHPLASMPTLVESCSRFMSLTSRLKCSSIVESSRAESPSAPAPPELPRSRIDFHNTFSMLINMGNVEKGCRRTISREEAVWQNELKDLIWLELRASLARRSLAQQDAELCAQRQHVPALIHSMLHYRFVSEGSCEFRPQDGEKINGENVTWAGCLSFTCACCWSESGRCLRAVGALLDAFFSAAELYPSTSAMTLDHPDMATPQFNATLKALCLWYNSMRRMRQALVSLHRLQPPPTPPPPPPPTDDAPDECDEEVSRRGCVVRFNLEPCAGAGSHPASSEDSQRDAADSANESCGETTDASAADNSLPVEPSTPEPGDPSSSSDSGYRTPRPLRASARTARPPHAAHAPRDSELTLDMLHDLAQLKILDKSDVSPYRHYLHELLKTQGVRRSTMFIYKMHRFILSKVHATLQPAQKNEDLLVEGDPNEMFGDAKLDDEQAENKEDENDADELRRYGWWSVPRSRMSLPSYRAALLLLSASAAELVRDYLQLRLAARRHSPQPSCFTVKQIIHELKEGLEIASDVRGMFADNVAVSLREYPTTARDRRHLLTVIRNYDATVEEALKQYLSYLVMTSEEKVVGRGVWQREWAFTARLAARIPAVADAAPHSFTEIICNQVCALRRRFERKFAELPYSVPDEDDIDRNDGNHHDHKRHLVYAICREVQNIYSSEREVTVQIVQYARAVASRLPTHSHCRQTIFESLMSLRECIVSQTLEILERSAQAYSAPPPSPAGGEAAPPRPAPPPAPPAAPDALLARLRELLLQVFKLGFELHKELYRYASCGFAGTGIAKPRPVSLQPVRSVETEHRAARRRPDTVIVHESFNPAMIHKELHRHVAAGADGGAAGGIAGGAERVHVPRAPAPLTRADSSFDDCDDRLFNQLNTGKTQPSIEQLLSGEEVPPPAEAPPPPQAPLPDSDAGSRVSRAIIDLARCWMRFVVERCERGRGLRPRWASQGLEFLMLACDPHNTRHLSDQEFEELKQLMDGCISHVIGSRPSTPRVNDSATRTRPRIHSPLSTTSTNSNSSSRSNCKDELTPTPSPNPSSESDPLASYNYSVRSRVWAACSALEASRDVTLRAAGLVGREVAAPPAEPVLRHVTFPWQRGLKIGAGTFGKVYTVINTDTGQLLAMKEVSIGAGDRRALQRAANELHVLEGVAHPHLVRYYGIELHREEMLIFMELCVEGSLEALVATSGALPEPAVRRYTGQLARALAELHLRRIAHRDIKSGNIFLTSSGRCLKLGDFGCAVKIRGNQTARGELQGCVGTQAYMAPEVFMQSSGHGRAADIWSLGCVVVEMATGKRPFSEYDSNYQIMFVVGMGGAPAVPASLSVEGRALCAACLTHEPSARPAARDLLAHSFLSAMKSEDDCECETGYFQAKRENTKL